MTDLDEVLISPIIGIILLWDWMKDNILILKRFRLYLYWKGKCKDKKYYELKRNCEFYLDSDLVNLKDPPIWKPKMESGKIGIYELVGFKSYNYTIWNFIGYEYYKPIKECSFKEFLKIYTK